MDADISRLIEQIHETHEKIVLVTTGAGTQAVADLFAIAGASNTMLESIVPYSKSASTEFLGQTPKKFVSQKTAQLLAGKALQRAYQLAEDDAPLIGVACTAAIATNRPKKGEHHAHITAWSTQKITTYSIKLNKGARNRAEEEALISRLIVNAIAEAIGFEQVLDIKLNAGDQYNTIQHDFQAATDQLLSTKIPYFAVHDHGRIRRQDVNPQVVLSGSFNPLHAGHVAMARAAMAHLGKPIAFEITAFNVDKPPLDKNVIGQRLTQFAGDWPVYITSMPTFVEKARIFGATTFVVGFDTAARIIEPRYYNNSETAMLAALLELQQSGCHFLVAGRVNKKGVFQTVADLNAPSEFEALFEPLADFRLDLSSSEIRTRQLDSR